MSANSKAKKEAEEAKKKSSKGKGKGKGKGKETGKGKGKGKEDIRLRRLSTRGMIVDEESKILAEHRVKTILDGISMACAQTSALYLISDTNGGNRLARFACESAKFGQVSTLGITRLADLRQEKIIVPSTTASDHEDETNSVMLKASAANITEESASNSPSNRASSQQNARGSSKKSKDIANANNNAGKLDANGNLIPDVSSAEDMAHIVKSEISASAVMQSVVARSSGLSSAPPAKPRLVREKISSALMFENTVPIDSQDAVDHVIELACEPPAFSEDVDFEWNSDNNPYENDEDLPANLLPLCTYNII